MPDGPPIPLRPPPRAKTVFISYSHGAPEHRENVLTLSERLCQPGVETLPDHHVNASQPNPSHRPD